jgi:hypothetical protein
MGEVKNTLKKNGPSQRWSRHKTEQAKHKNQYHNNNHQHSDCDHFAKTVHVLQSGINDIF